nr:hypothetical protein [Tanacetum cinerariifolium]
MEEFVTKNRANYYSRITNITVNVGNVSKWFDEFKGSITTWVDLTENFLGKYYPPSHTYNVVGTEAKRVLTNTMFEKCQEVVTNEGFSDLEKVNNDDEHEIAKIFRIKTNLFDYETPLCKAFNEFNYLFKVDTELFTHDIERTKTYEDYENGLNNEGGEPWSKNGVLYEICDHICEPFHFKSGKTNWPTYNLNENGFSKGGELPGMEEQHKQGQCDLFNDLTQGPPVCKIRRFEMVKYSFGQKEEHVAIMEYEMVGDKGGVKEPEEKSNLKTSRFFIIAVQTLGSGISILLAVGTPSTGSGNLYC